MSFTHGRGVRTFINTTECSAFLNNVEQSISREMSETSVFGSAVKTYTKGLRDSTITLSGYWDGATDAIDAVLSRLYENVNLLPAGDAVANYTDVTGVTNAVTPISGFTNSIYFQDNLANREATKTPSEIVANAVYFLSATVQMDDTLAPVHYVDGVAFNDFRINPLPSANVSLIASNVYRVSNRFSFADASYNGRSVGRIVKQTTYTSRGFRLAGLTLEATNLTNAISILDEGNTLGAKALVASAKATSYQVTNAVADTVAVSAEFQVDGSGNAANSVTDVNLLGSNTDIPLSSYTSSLNVTNSPGGIPGFTNSVAFGNNSVARNAVLNPASSPPAGTFYTFSFYVLMDDGLGPPVPGTSVSASFDFGVINHSSQPVTSASLYTLTNVYGNVYLFSISRTATSSSNGWWIEKGTANTARTFKITAMSLSIPRLPTGAFRGQVLAPLAVRSNNSTSTALDNGVGTTNGMVFNIHMLNNATTTQVIIQHSPDGSTWADLFRSYQTASIKFAQSGATVGPVNRYLRTLVTTSGSPQILVTAARR